MKKSLKLIRNPTVLNNKGFTMVEALMGITVAGAVMGSVAPLLMFAVATRLQTYKAEQAMQIAQGEINRIQVLMAQGVDKDEEVGILPPAVNTGVKLSEAAAPAIIVTNASDLNAPNKALEYDLDNNSSTVDDKFLIQTFRDEGIRFDQGTAANQLAIFQVGIRVYSISAKDHVGELETDIIALNVTQDLSQQLTRPLAVLYTEVSRSDLKYSLQKYRDYLTSKTTQK